MSDYYTVRDDPSYPEKLDPEIIPLCDALNESGFATISSCCGHGSRWPAVWFEHESDDTVETMARCLLQSEMDHSYPHSTSVKKEILRNGHRWSLHIHLNDVFGDTPVDVAMAEAVTAMDIVTRQIRLFAQVAPYYGFRLKSPLPASVKGE